MKRKRHHPTSGRKMARPAERYATTAAYGHAKAIDEAFREALPSWIRIVMGMKRVPHRVKRFLGQHLSGVEVVIHDDRTEIWRRGVLFKRVERPIFTVV